jgi:hypothetical protein
MIFFGAAEENTKLQSMLQEQVGCHVVGSTTLAALPEYLRGEELLAFVVDQRLLEAEARTAELVWQLAGVTLPVVVDLRVQSEEQVVREVRLALGRRERERRLCRDAVRREVAATVANALTGTMVQLELALEDERLVRSTRLRLERALHSAEQLRSVLAIKYPENGAPKQVKGIARAAAAGGGISRGA